jgi:hypothetical protein
MEIVGGKSGVRSLRGFVLFTRDAILPVGVEKGC